MSVASIDHTIDETAVEDYDREVVDATVGLDGGASLRRPFTRAFEPRHRADGPEPRHRANGPAV